MKRIYMLFFIIVSCRMDSVEQIAIIKNLSNKNIIFFQGTDTLTDDDLFFGSKFYIKPHKNDTIYGGYISLLTNKENEYFYILSYDSFKKYNINEHNGIVRNSFLKKIVIPVDSLTNNKILYYY